MPFSVATFVDGDDAVCDEFVDDDLITDGDLSQLKFYSDAAGNDLLDHCLYTARTNLDSTPASSIVFGRIALGTQPENTAKVIYAAIDFDGSGSPQDCSNWSGAHSDVVGMYPFEEATGAGNRIDVTTNQNDLTAIDADDANSIASATGKFGNAINFEFTESEYLKRTDDTDFEFSTGDAFIVQYLIKTEAYNSITNYVACKYNMDSDEREWMSGIDSTGDSRLVVSEDGTFPDAYSDADNDQLSTGTWYHITHIHDPEANETFIYIDGVLSDSDTVGGTIYSGTADFLVGAKDDDNAIDGFLDAILDELQIEKTNLSSDNYRLAYAKAYNDALTAPESWSYGGAEANTAAPVDAPGVSLFNAATDVSGRYKEGDVISGLGGEFSVAEDVDITVADTDCMDCTFDNSAVIQYCPDADKNAILSFVFDDYTIGDGEDSGSLNIVTCAETNALDIQADDGGTDIDLTVVPDNDDNGALSKLGIIIDDTAGTISTATYDHDCDGASSDPSTAQGIGDSPCIRIEWDEPMTGFISPGEAHIAVDMGENNRDFTFLEGISESVWLFQYTIVAGDRTTDATTTGDDIEVVTGLKIYDLPMQDGDNGNEADYTLGATDLGVGVVEGPTDFYVTSVNTPGGHGYWVAGDYLTLTVSEAVNTAVAGTYALPITLAYGTPFGTPITDNLTLDEDYWNVVGKRRKYNGTMTVTGDGVTVTGFLRSSTGTAPAGFNNRSPLVLMD